MCNKIKSEYNWDTLSIIINRDKTSVTLTFGRIPLLNQFQYTNSSPCRSRPSTEFGILCTRLHLDYKSDLCATVSVSLQLTKESQCVEKSFIRLRF